MGVSQMQTNSPDSFQIVDVRIGPVPNRIPGSIVLPVDELKNRMDELDKNKLIVLYCWDTWCSLAMKAAIPLLESGYRAKELFGGIAAWNAMSFPVSDSSTNDKTKVSCNC
jgi:rhodanese-related sulfurtransferase